VRDCRKDYKNAFNLVNASIRSLVEDDLWDRVDENPVSDESQKVRLAIWRFVKSESGLPSVSLTAAEWISQLRVTLAETVLACGAKVIPNLNLKIKRTGLNESQMELPLFEAETLFPAIRQETSFILCCAMLLSCWSNSDGNGMLRRELLVLVYSKYPANATFRQTKRNV